MPEIHWRHYAENKLAPIRRKLTGRALCNYSIPLRVGIADRHSAEIFRVDLEQRDIGAD